jgi:hypothetical protein
MECTVYGTRSLADNFLDLWLRSKSVGDRRRSDGTVCPLFSRSVRCVLFETRTFKQNSSPSESWSVATILLMRGDGRGIVSADATAFPLVHHRLSSCSQ